MVRDFSKGEFSPDLEHEDFTLLGRQLDDRRLKATAALVIRTHPGIKPVNGLIRGVSGFPLAPPIISADAIQRRPPYRNQHEGQRIARQVALVTPITHEGILNDVLGIRLTPRPLPRREQEPPSVGAKPVAPL